MNETVNTLEGIRDIAPPAIPWQVVWENAAPGIIVLGLFVLISFGILLHFIWRRYFSSVGQARRRLNALQQAHHTKILDSHQTAFQLSEILRETFRLTQLSTQTPLPEKLGAHKDRWRAFIEHLATARYARPEDTRLSELLADAQFWLGRWPHNNND